MIARWFWREWRSPSLLIVWLALSLAVACVLALGNISDRMEKGLSQQSREFMAGDRALRSSREVPQAWLEEAQKRGLKVGKQLTFATMTFAGDTPQLANVKAVDDIYPMYGDLQTNPPGLKPQAGSVLLAPRLMALLNLKTGDTIDVGDATLRIAGEVIQEPDSGFNPFQMAPRLMMNLADVDKTGAVQPGSRVTWRYKFGGSENQLDSYEKWLLPQLKRTTLVRSGTGRRRAGAIDGTLATVPAAFGASDLAAGSGSSGGSDESLLSQSLRSGGDPQNAGGRASATA